MKKIFYSMIVLAMTAFTFTSCEDVPMPYNLPDLTGKGGSSTSEVAPSGAGTVADPYNVAAADSLITAGAYTSDKVYTKGVITSVSIDTNYGNATYYISDNNSNSLEVYRGYYYNGDKFTSTDQLAVGDTVVVYGVLTNYNGTHEITQGSQLYSVNGATANGGGSSTVAGTPKGTGTAADPYNVAAAIKASSALDASGKVEGIYVTGTVSAVGEVSTSFGNATYYISDDGTTTNQFEIYRGYYLNGDKFTSTDQIKVGQKVTVMGDLVNFKGNTIEMTQGSKLISIEGTGSDDNTNTGNNESVKGDVTVAASDFGIANAAEMGTQTKDGITYTFTAGSNKNAPKFYSAGEGTIRMYPGNAVEIKSGKTIESIVIVCDSYNGTDYTAEGLAKTSAGTISLNGLTYTISGIKGTTVTITNGNSSTGGASQLRIKTIAITYAK